jgi:hypothetical protein
MKIPLREWSHVELSIPAFTVARMVKDHMWKQEPLVHKHTQQEFMRGGGGLTSES